MMWFSCYLFQSLILTSFCVCSPMIVNFNPLVFVIVMRFDDSPTRELSHCIFLHLSYNFCLQGFNWKNNEKSIFVTIWGFRWLLVSMKSLLIHVLFFIFPRFCGSMILLWGCQNKGDQCKDEYAFFKDSSSILKANMLIFNLSILFSANKFAHFGYYDLQSSGIQF